MAVLDVRELSKSYGANRALDRLTLSISGAATGLLGPNGAGKSTLIKILLGLIRPTGGSASVFDLDSQRASLKIRSQVGYMPEHESHVPGMDAVGYVHLAGRLVGMSHADAMQRTHAVLNYVGLNEERYRKLETYSTGMKQKAKFAQAIVHHPKLLLLDEPTAGLDPGGRDEMLALIRDVSRGKGISVLISTHILHDVEATCDEVAILDRGALVRQGTLASLKAGGVDGYDVRIKGDGAPFVGALAASGHDVQPIEEGLRIVKRDGPPAAEPIIRAAAQAGIQLRRLERSRPTLEELFKQIVAKSRGSDHGNR